MLYTVNILFFQFSIITLGYGTTPYAPTDVGTSPGGSEIGHYAYDTANNRLTKTQNGKVNPSQTITMDLMTKPETITTRSETGMDTTETFKNGIGGQRYLRVTKQGGDTKTRLYLNGICYR